MQQKSHIFKFHTGSLRVKSGEKMYLHLGSYTKINQAKGFAIEISGDHSPSSILTDINFIGTEESYTLFLEVSNKCGSSIVVEVWQIQPPTY